jgi:hypothetical protein
MHSAAVKHRVRSYQAHSDSRTSVYARLYNKFHMYTVAAMKSCRSEQSTTLTAQVSTRHNSHIRPKQPPGSIQTLGARFRNSGRPTKREENKPGRTGDSRLLRPCQISQTLPAIHHRIRDG